MPGSRTKPWIVDDELWGLIEPLLPQTKATHDALLSLAACLLCYSRYRQSLC